jgi:hypothetical protein
MVDRAVSLPEPRPEDDEDVVWGLSTASALWARGERHDAIVWLRRAAEAATAAGQGFRGSELGMYATELEDTLQASQAGDDVGRPTLTSGVELDEEESPKPPPPLPPRAQTMRPAPEAAVSAQVPRADATASAPKPPRPSHDGAASGPKPPLASRAAHDGGAGDGKPTAAEGGGSLKPPPPSPVRSPTIKPPVTSSPPTQPMGSPPIQGLHGLMAMVAGPSTPPLSAATPTPPRAEPKQASVAPPPPQAAAPAPAPAPPASAAASADDTVASSAATSEGAAPIQRKKTNPRAPILDPWAEETSPNSSRAVITAPFPVLTGENADEVLLSVRSRLSAPRSDKDDDEVVTSAAPLEATLRKSARPLQPPPPPPAASQRKATEQDLKSPLSGPRGAIDKTKAAVPAKTSTAPATPPQARTPANPLAQTLASEPQSAKAPPPAPSAPTTTGVEKESRSRPKPSGPGLVAPPASGEAAPAKVAEVTAAAPAPEAPAPVVAAPAAPAPAPAPPPPAPAAPSAPSAAPAAAARPRPASSAPPADRATLAGVHLDEVDAFADLPSDVQHELARVARIESLKPDEEVSAFGAALLLQGEAVICATLVDAPACRAVRGTVVPSRGSLNEPVPLRVVAGSGGGSVAVWDQAVVEEALKTCPWVMEELVARANRLQALAGATIGPLGDIDESFRNMLLDRLTLRVAEPHERIAHKGKATGIALVGAGSVDLIGSDADSIARPGDFLFARAVLENQPAPLDAHAGAQGALLLVGDRQIAQELFVTAPPLVAVLSGEG